MGRALMLAILVCMLALPGIVFAEEEKGKDYTVENDKTFFTIGGQYRARYEYNEAKDFAEDTEADFFSHRARLNLTAGHEDYFRVFLSMQDVRFWGEEADTLGDYMADNFDMHQAYGELFLDDIVILRVGRQEIAYDAHRLLGTVNWTQQARAFDAIRLMFNFGNVSLSGFYSELTDPDVNADPTLGYIDLASGHLRYQPMDAVGVSLVYLHDSNTGLRRYRNTSGLYVDGKVEGFSYAVEGYYQNGDIGEDVSIAAYMAAARAGYVFDVAVHPGISAWYEMLSGDDDLTDDEVGAFDTLFATNHKFYGHMDIFLNIPVHTAGLGLHDAGGRLQITPWKPFTLAADFHYFQLDQKDAADETLLGTEVDLMANLAANKNVKLSAGYSMFTPDKAMENISGGDEAEAFAYGMMDFAF
jgi:Alginate export